MAHLTQVLALAAFALSGVQATELSIQTKNGSCVGFVEGDGPCNSKVVFAKGMTCEQLKTATLEAGNTTASALTHCSIRQPLTIGFEPFVTGTNLHQLCLNLGYGSTLTCEIHGLSGNCSASQGDPFSSVC